MKQTELDYLKNKVLTHLEEYLSDYQYRRGLVNDIDYLFEEYGTPLVEEEDE